ncbi:MAG: MBOAT family protein [Coriobacteriales bacterium]|jgi:alginate O-acetyltransferase complex protein AlgI|nr:MBOAT family protein [Coriobacteriales bacterium]
MYFSSLIFLCVFLPVVFLGHLVLPWIRAKNVLLIAASLLFYAYGEPVYVLLMLASAILNWIFGLCVRRPVGVLERNATKTVAGSAFNNTTRRQIVGDSTANRQGADNSITKKQSTSGYATKIQSVCNNAGKKPVLVLALIINLGFLAVFKYAGLAAQSMGFFIGTEAASMLPFANIALPIGISFYTFQAISYVIDVYRGQTEPQRSAISVLLYISFFPQLIAGPIIKYHDVQKQLNERTIKLSNVALGLRRFSVGLAKKVLISNVMAVTVDTVFTAPASEINIATAWIGALAYLAQIYFDFSGYSDMALGLAKMFGFDYPENFRYPYVSRSIKDFWRRWHISLSTWFKEYLYIPLGGNRHGRVRASLNKLIVFFLCGLWHGASWTFVVWGLFHGFFLMLEEFLPIRKLPRIIGTIYALLVVCIGFVLFRADSFAQALFMLQQMFTGWHFELICRQLTFSLLNTESVIIFVLAIVAAAPIAQMLRKKARELNEDELNAGEQNVYEQHAHRLNAGEQNVQEQHAHGLNASEQNVQEQHAHGLNAGEQIVQEQKASKQKTAIYNCAQVASYAGAFLLIVLCFLSLSSGGYNPFIYFRF